MEQQIKADLLSNAGLDDISQGYLLQTLRWTKFIAIMGFILTGLVGIAVLLALIAAPLSFSAYFSVLYLLLYFYPSYCLYQFSRYMKSGLYYEDKLQVMQAFRHQRNMYRYLGIMLIVMIALFAILFMSTGLLAGIGAI